MWYFIQHSTILTVKFHGFKFKYENMLNILYKYLNSILSKISKPIRTKLQPPFFFCYICKFVIISISYRIHPSVCINNWRDKLDVKFYDPIDGGHIKKPNLFLFYHSNANDFFKLFLHFQSFQTAWHWLHFKKISAIIRTPYLGQLEWRTVRYQHISRRFVFPILFFFFIPKVPARAFQQQQRREKIISPIPSDVQFFFIFGRISL